MRFSFWPQPSQSFEIMQKLGHHVEQSSWDGIWLADHFMPDAKDTSSPMPEAWTTLAGLAATVPRVRLGTLVTGNTYRHPAVLAKMAATVDHISGGRLVLGLGSGWQENEHKKYGIDFHTVNGRLRRLEEACQVIKALFTEGSASYQGQFYRLDEAPLEPKPVQAKLPLLIGGGGEKVTLRITAQYADEWNVWGTVDTLKHKMAILDQHCNEIGRDPENIQRSAVALLFLSDDASFVKKMRDNVARATIAGSVSEVRDIIAAYQEIGVDEVIIPDFTLGLDCNEQKMDTLDKFIEDVAPVAR
ncbi:MAG: LLM class F420-dependent oxidoreductase [bacterium]|nr:LLM class F420-dependent oxidoreductase [Gammaproteobacteria bacterium]HIL98035.1 LLM class F420-dependent oxidoreductase [Pseudomonadales bacterium]